LMLVDRVQEMLRRRDAARAVTAPHHPSAAPAMRQRRAGHRRVIALDGCLDATAVGTLVEMFWDAVEEGADEIRFELSPVSRLAPDAVEQLVQLEASAYELGIRIVLDVPPGPAHDVLRQETELETNQPRRCEAASRSVRR
jgi:hypothetical protein